MKTFRQMHKELNEARKKAGLKEVTEQAVRKAITVQKIPVQQEGYKHPIFVNPKSEKQIYIYYRVPK